MGFELSNSFSVISVIRCDDKADAVVLPNQINETYAEQKVVNGDPSELNDNPKVVNDTLVVVQEDGVSYNYVRKILYVVSLKL